MRKAVVTVTIGEHAEAPHATIATRYMEAYAAKIGADFVRIVSGSEYNYWYAMQANTWLFNIYDRILYFDSDVIVRPECPDMSELVDADTMGVVFEQRDDESCRAHYIVAERLYGKLPPNGYAEWKAQYFNAGVLVLAKKHKHLFEVDPQLTIDTEAAVCAYTDRAGGDQTMLNYRVLVSKTPVKDLGPAYNRAFFKSFEGYDRDDAMVWHYTGPSKDRMVDDLMRTLEPALSPDALYLVLAQRRSGHHAIINWLAQQHGQITRQEDTLLLNGKLVLNEPIHVGNKPRATIFNIEDVGTTELAAWWPLIRKKYGLQHKRIIPVVIVRDLYNWQASTLEKWNQYKNVHWERWRAPGLQRYRLDQWAEQVRWFLRGVCPLGHCVGISYNNWCADKGYRRAIASALNVPFTDAGFDYVPPHAGGSSFDFMQFQGQGSAMETHTRFANTVYPRKLQELIDLPKYQELQAAAFPDAPRKETMTGDTPTTATADVSEVEIRPSKVKQAPLNIMTITKADDWVYNTIPRWLAFVNENAGPCKKHILLACENHNYHADTVAYMVQQLNRHFDQVVAIRYDDPFPGKRLLYFDKLRSALLDVFELAEGLYMDPDTDVVGSLQHLPTTAPDADLLWAANPSPVPAVVADLGMHGFDVEQPLMEAGYIYMRRSFRSDFEAAQQSFPALHPFMPGSTYWNMLKQHLGAKAHQLTATDNTTFWDIPAAVHTAKTVHYTGQWKRLLPYITYNRGGGSFIGIQKDVVQFPEYEIMPYDQLGQ